MAIGGNGPEYGALLAQRHGDDCARAPKFDESTAHGTYTCLRPGIMDLKVGSTAKQAFVAASRLWVIRCVRQNFREPGRYAMQCDRMEALAVEGP